MCVGEFAVCISMLALRTTESVKVSCASLPAVALALNCARGTHALRMCAEHYEYVAMKASTDVQA